MTIQEELWVDVGHIDDVPLRGARVVETPRGGLAIFKTSDGALFALWDRCPHKGGPLSQGIVHGRSVTCPLHNWVVGLETGEVQGPDKGCVRKVTVRQEDGRILLPANAMTGRRAA
jgi:nitrite reductase (NADH) small subunit